LKAFNELADGPVVRTQEMQVPFLLQTSCVGPEKSRWRPRSPAGAGQTWSSRHRAGGTVPKKLSIINGRGPFQSGISSTPPLA